MCKTLEIQIKMSERSELWVGLRASEASLPPEASQVARTFAKSNFILKASYFFKATK